MICYRYDYVVIEEHTHNFDNLFLSTMQGSISILFVQDITESMYREIFLFIRKS